MSSKGKKIPVTKKKAITKKKRAPPTKKEKDLNAPKRPKTAYIFYCSDQRAKVKEEDPSLKFGDIAKKLSSQWKEMSEEEKDPYVKMAQQDKERYQKESSSYKKKPAPKKKKASEEEDDDDDEDDDDEEDSD